MIKQIDELCISKIPWKVETKDYPTEYGCGIADYLIRSSNDGIVNKYVNIRDARLIASAPKLYKHLREAVIEMCRAYCERSDGKCDKEDGECFVQEWIKTLEEASGESEEK